MVKAGEHTHTHTGQGHNAESGQVRKIGHKKKHGGGNGNVLKKKKVDE